MKLPQLTLRELFLLVVIAAMGCGWWVERGRLMAELQRSMQWKPRFDALQEAIESAEYSVQWSDDSVSIKKSYGDFKRAYSASIPPTP